MTDMTTWSLRRATPDDVMAVAAVHVASWREGYRAIVAGGFLDALVVGDRARRYTFGLDGPNDPRTWLCLDATGVVGFVTTGPSRDENLVAAGEVLALYVAPSHWRSGAGTMLMGKATEELRAEGLRRAALWVLAANDRGRAFYEAQGWRADGAADAVTIGDQALAQVRYQKEFATRRSCACEKDRGTAQQRLGARYLRYVNYQTNRVASSERATQTVPGDLIREQLAARDLALNTASQALTRKLGVRAVREEPKDAQGSLTEGRFLVWSMSRAPRPRGRRRAVRGLACRC